ncbi:MAG: SH3 domain-containing protein, partial [Caldilinea sp.]
PSQQTAAPAQTAATSVVTNAVTSAGEPVVFDSNGVIGVIMGAGAKLYDAPSGESILDLPGAEAVTVAGRDADGAWLMVQTLNGRQGWMQASDLVVFGVEELPEMSGQDSAEVPVAASDDVTTEPITITAASPPLPASPAPATQVEEAASTAPSTISGTLPDLVMGGTANVSGARLNIRSGPGSEYRIIGKAGSGEALGVAARSEDSAWLTIVRDDLPVGAGWVAADLVRLDGEVNELPLSDEVFGGAAISAPAAVTPVPAVTAAPSAADATAPAQSTIVATLASTATQATAQPIRSTGPTGLSGNIVFHDGRGSIYVYDLTRGDVRFLTSGFDPAISRDGSKVAFLRNGIHTINIDGAGERKVHDGSELISSPKWSPDGNWIVFSRLLGEYKCFDTEFFGCVSALELAGRFGIPVEFVRRFFPFGDAERIALPNFGLSRVNADGDEFRDIAALDSAQAPDWNEAGIVYQSKAGLEITEDTPDGDTRSVQNGNWDWDPDWAPNGGRIIYQSKEGPHWEIFSINPDGSGEFALTRPVTTLVDQLPSNVSGAFSYDGNHIVYLSNRNEKNDAGPWRLWVMNADGSNQRPLPLDMEIDYGFGGEQVASWGP